jgi:4-amino-4-deoxy-L-arabinose transferase-like glycosyltransferase
VIPRTSGPRLVLAACLALLAAGLGRLVLDGLAYLRSPYSRDYGEGVVLALSELLAQRGSYFGPIGEYPMVHANYPPVFIVLAAASLRLFGPSLAATRALSLLSTAALVAVVYAIVRRRGREHGLAACAALMLVAPWFVDTWAPLGRVDMLACLFSVAGLGLFASGEGAPRGRWWAAGACFVLGVYTKQTALVAPTAALLSLLRDPASRRLVPRFLLVFALPAGALLLVLVLATGGQAWAHLVTYTAAADYSLAALRKGYESFLVISGPLLAIVLLGLGACREDLLGRRDLPFALYWLLNLGALVTTAKAGAAQNYLIEPWLATVLMAALALIALRERSPEVFRWWPAMMLAAAAGALVTDRDAARPPRPIRNPGQATEYHALDEAVAAAGGPILSENLSVLVRQGKPVLAEPFGLLLLSRQGLWRPDRLVADCEAGRFALVVEEDRLRDIPGIDACLHRRYELQARLGPYDLFRPRPAEAP